MFFFKQKNILVGIFGFGREGLALFVTTKIISPFIPIFKKKLKVVYPHVS